MAVAHLVVIADYEGDEDFPVLALGDTLSVPYERAVRLLTELPWLFEPLGEEAERAWERAQIRQRLLAAQRAEWFAELYQPREELRLKVLQNHRYHEAVYLAGDEIQVTPLEAEELLYLFPQVFAFASREP